MSRKEHESGTSHLPASDYFADVAREVFDDYFAQRGAHPVPPRGADIVRYESQHWFAEVVYLPSDGPRYAPRVEIGVLPESFSDPRRNRIDVLHTTPRVSELRGYNLDWRYTNRLQAQEAFSRVRDDIMAIYTEPILNDTARLQALLEQRNEELNRQWADEIQRHNDGIAREAADAAFRTGDYESAVRHLATISSESLSPSDRKRLDLAQRKMSAFH